VSLKFFRNPPVMLKIVPKAGYESTGQKQPMIAMESRNGIFFIGRSEVLN
jgi:hypothetical protein